jgi:hypothetical protein
MTHKSELMIRLVFTFAVLFPLAGCKKPNSSPAVEKPISASALPAPQTQPAGQQNVPPPTMRDVQETVHRIFGDDVVVSSREKVAFIAGDFNGDEVQDLAVFVEPVAEKLSDINSELANWTIQDADQFFLPTPGARVVNMPEIKLAHVEKDEILLAVIHGFGSTAWRNPQARQAYLVKHAAATFLGTSRSFSEKYIREMKLAIQTDVIEARRDKKFGFFFWTGSNYAWHPRNS